MNKPWQSEPDREEFEHAGLPCLLNRGPSGAWCGYVAVSPGHPLHGKGYDSHEISVHGGLTYANSCHGEICHVPKPGDPDNVWWFGFDCAHAGDFMPKFDDPDNEFNRQLEEKSPGWLSLTSYKLGNVYRDIDYVREETRRLADQLKELGA